MLLKNSFTILFIILNSFTLKANVEFRNRCEDLHAYICSKVNNLPVTGIIKKIDKSENKVKECFSKAVSSQNKSYFLKVAYGALDLKQYESCNTPYKEKNIKCQNEMIKELTKISKIFSYSKYPLKMYYSEKATKDDIAYLIKNESFKACNSIIQNDLVTSEMIKEKFDIFKNKFLPETKLLLLKKLKKMNISPQDFKIFQEKINSIEAAELTCTLKNNKPVDDLLLVNAANFGYSSITGFCPAFFLTEDWQKSSLPVLVHELFHSVDPCLIQLGPMDLKISLDNLSYENAVKRYPLSNLLACLQNPRSIGAKYLKSDDNNKDRKHFCIDDQIGESMADWFATEITADEISKDSSSLTREELIDRTSDYLRALCENNTTETSEKKIFDVHPPLADRINKIYLVNPKIQELLRCYQPPRNIGYCDGQTKFPQFDLNWFKTPKSEIPVNTLNQK